MNRHLVAIEVGIVGRAHQRMELNRLALDDDRFKSLNAKPVQRGRAIQKYWMLANDLIENIPNLRAFLFHHFLGALDRGDVASFFELVINKWLKELERHFFRQSAL